jgi:hypothetical protein
MLHLDRVPRLETDSRAAADPLRPLRRREHPAGTGEKLAAGGIEVVAVMLVRQQHDVDRLDRGWFQRRPRSS